MDASLLLTKLFIPSVPPNIIHRPQLIERLTAGLQAGKLLTVVSAPAGYGKSTMLAQWITAYQGQVAWLSLDDRDNHPLRFWRYFVAALQTVSPALGQTALPLLEDAQDLDVQRFLTALVNDVAVGNQALILILDDYHVISNADIHAAMKTLLEHALPALHLVIATRTDPPLPMSRLRVRGHMTEVRLADLRFSTDEATVFFNGLMNLALPAADVEALEIRTEGWIAGLQLAALSLQDRADVHTFIQAFTGSQHLVLEYLVEEVLTRQPASLQAFLLETSILQRMCAPLCNAVTAKTASEHALSDLQRRNLFLIPLDAEHYWFRYHHLFAEFLKSHLKRTQADALPALHRRAAEWFQANGYPEEALHHAFAIPDYAYVSRLVVDNWRRIYHTGRLATAVQWLESLPGDLLRQSPPLGVAYCWTLFIRGDYAQIDAYLDDITQAFERMVAAGALPVDHPEYNIILHQVMLLRAVVMRHQGEVAAAIQEIEQLLPTVAGFRHTFGPIVVAMGYTACYSQMGYNYVAANDLAQADAYLSRVSTHARACGNFFALAHATMEWAKISLAQGRIEHAEKICRYELSLAEQPAYAAYPAFCLIQLALADVLCAKGAWDEAETLLAQGLETARRNGHQYYLAQGYLIAARLHHAQGNPTLAQDAVHQAERIAVSIRNRFLDAALAETQTAVASTSLPGQPLIEPLTERELDVLRLICAGKSNQEIADELLLALNTVKRHVNNLYGKLGVSRRAQAIIEARRLALV
ncbi:LuxR C-terminal-related transcriptional regulator [Candidatus Chloroploca asiatica]|uniref:HTH luxR-type domain-containing protein n=1 Tax=Candidatus Chloroploca asiatica TaxID=1506545 RepID=A0A2H3KZK1_9CHLR|nr:LuxR C-terminal-related transcriptional regulator [Candidatus Chloroploca asiatica]PDV97791.1 hypothetical protein A9Q02_17545 [Candidatus Chloroploca asiatica]